MSSITASIAIMPCGPPKPRNAVFETVLVLQRCETISHVLEEIGVVDVAERAVVHRPGQIGRVAAARGEHQVESR